MPFSKSKMPFNESKRKVSFSESKNEMRFSESSETILLNVCLAKVKYRLAKVIVKCDFTKRACNLPLLIDFCFR